MLSIVAMTRSEKYCIISAYLQWLFQPGEQAVAHGPFVVFVAVFLHQTIPFGTQWNCLDAAVQVNIHKIGFGAEVKTLILNYNFPYLLSSPIK